MTEEIDNTIETISGTDKDETSSNASLPQDHRPSEKPNKMNTILLWMNIVMLAGLVVLYILFFNSSGWKSNPISGAVAKANKGAISIAYVNNDSILNNYDLVKKMRGDLEVKSKKLESEIASKQAAFEKDAAYFQEQVNKKSLSDKSAEEIYAQLQKNQKNIVGLRDKYAADLQQNEAEMNVALLDSVMNFLHRYNNKYKFDYILGYTKSGNVLYANDTLDVTKDVIRELNAEYQRKHGGK